MTEAEWWNGIAAFAKEQNWAAVTWEGRQDLHEVVLSDTVLDDSEASWRFSIPLGAAGVVVIQGRPEGKDASVDLQALALLLEESIRNPKLQPRAEVRKEESAALTDGP